VVQVWLVDLERSAALLEAVETATPRLSDDDQVRIDALNDADLKRQRRLTTIALRVLISAYSGGPEFDRLPFERLGNGKPVLPGAKLQFSITHAGERALVALGSVVPLGVDVEVLRAVNMPNDRQQAIVRAARTLGPFPQSEYTFEASDHRYRVLRAWVRLEALAKAHGCGIARVLAACGVLARSASVVRDAPAFPANLDGGLSNGNPIIKDLVLPPGADGQPWFAALATFGSLDELGSQDEGDGATADPSAGVPEVRHLPTTQAGMAELLAGI